MAGGERKEGDALKMYTVVMGLLVVVMAVLYFVIDARRDEYAQANAEAERWMTGKGQRLTLDDTPQTYPDLALEVERLSASFSEASGGSGLSRNISQEIMERAATAAGLRIKYASRERNTPNNAGRYVTISVRYDFGAQSGEDVVEIWRVLTLLYNIEVTSRYRVSEVTWQVADPNEDPDPPYDLVKRVQLEVSLRVQSI